MSEGKSSFKQDYISTVDVQRLLLRASRKKRVKHIFLKFKSSSSGREFMNSISNEISWADGQQDDSKYDISIGLTFRGLEALDVLEGYLHIFRHLAPAFTQGAAVRAAEKLGDVGTSATRYWDELFLPDQVHAVVTVHGTPKSTEEIQEWEDQRVVPGLSDSDENVVVTGVLFGEHLDPPVGESEQTGSRYDAEDRSQSDSSPDTLTDTDETDHWHQPVTELFHESPKDSKHTVWLHFGYRDGLTSNIIRTNKNQIATNNVHEPGELLLGEPRNIGDNPWSLVDRTIRIRRFFKHGSFGVIRQIEQDELCFRRFIGNAVEELQRQPEWKNSPALSSYVRAKLCGRWPNGQIVNPNDTPDKIPEREIERNNFNYGVDEASVDNASVKYNPSAINDLKGLGCPFASHIRRMNPRDEKGIQMHRRPVFRRGVPYGPWYKVDEDKNISRGLLGVFFCSDLRNQFEHLLGEWVDRKPLGTLGDRNQKDPLIGAHTNDQSTFTITRPVFNTAAAIDNREGKGILHYGYKLDKFEPFVRTRGTAYCFYPSKFAMKELGNNGPWVEKEDEQWLSR